MLWVLKRTVKIDGYENINNFRLKILVYLNLYLRVKFINSKYSIYLLSIFPLFLAGPLKRKLILSYMESIKKSSIWSN